MSSSPSPTRRSPRRQPDRAIAPVRQTGATPQGGVVGWLKADLVPVQSRQLDMAAQEAAGLRCQPGELASRASGVGIRRRWRCHEPPRRRLGRHGGPSAHRSPAPGRQHPLAGSRRCAAVMRPMQVQGRPAGGRLRRPSSAALLPKTPALLYAASPPSRSRHLEAGHALPPRWRAVTPQPSAMLDPAEGQQ